jgi:Protein of unknwon function (DUF3310)
MMAIILNPESPLNNVNHPKHYGGADNPYEVIKVLEEWLSTDELRGFLKGNIHKYLARSNSKGASREDCAKAAWYAARLTNFNDLNPPTNFDGAVVRQLQDLIAKHGKIREGIQQLQQEVAHRHSLSGHR